MASIIQSSNLDSSIISEEIRDEMAMTQSMMQIPDEVGTMSSKPALMVSFTQSKVAAKN